MPRAASQASAELPLLSANIYDYPRYYELAFGCDCRAEIRFLREVFRLHGRRASQGQGTQRLFEPACGTGRLLLRLAKVGFDVAGLDLNEKAVDYCNRRFAKHGLPRTAVVGDMCDFKLNKKFDAAFNTINSFRHLTTDEQATAHLRCIADSLKTGGVYVLGLHLTPAKTAPPEDESWSARRGHLAVLSRITSLGIDRRRRIERFGMTYDIYTPTQSFRLASEGEFRTYTHEQLAALIAGVPELEWVTSYDFEYNAQQPIAVDRQTQDIVLVLKKK